MPSLRDKTVSGIFWSFVQKVGTRGISFIVMIYLARLLSPKDFGLIGMLMIFIQVSQAIVDGGFKLALIQKKDTDEQDYSSVFYINLIVSFILYLIIYFVAPLISDFYNQPLLTSLIRVLSLTFVINSFSLVQEARLTKQIRFKTLMSIHIPSTIVGGIISITMAFAGFGVWSIIAFQLASRTIYACQIWVFSKWKPLFFFRWQRVKTLFSFGSRLLIAKIIGVVYDNIFLVVIGKFYSVSSVGYYQNAFNLVNTPSGTITSALNGVTFSAFSSIQDDNQRLKVGYQRIMQQALFWICPAYVLLGVLAMPLFDFLFGPKWLPAVPYFRLLCIVGILAPLNTYNLNIVNVKGRSDIFLKLQLVRRVITILAIISVFPLGITALLIVQAASSVFTFCLFSYYSGKFINYSFAEQTRDMFPIFILSIAVGSIVLLFNRNLVGLSSVLQLLLGYGLGISIYLLLAQFLKFTPWLDFKHTFNTKILSRFISKY